MLTLSPQLRIANTHAVLHGAYGDVSQRARDCGTSRQALYRDAPKVLQALDGQYLREQLRTLQDDNHSLRRRLAQLEDQLRQVVLLDRQRQAHFASTASAEGVSLPVTQRLLAVLLGDDTPSVATLGRMTAQAARRATALLEVLDDASRPRAEHVAADEIFFGKTPCLMVVEQHSLCWLSGRLTQQRTGAEWAQEFRQLPRLRQTTQDGGTALAKGVALVNDERQAQGQTPIVAQDDHFHLLREGQRVLRSLRGRVGRHMDQAEEADRKAAHKARQSGDGRGRGAAAKAWRRAERSMDAYATAETAWGEVEQALRLFTPSGALNTRAAAEAAIALALPSLSDPSWAKVRRGLARAELLAYLDAASASVAALALPEEVRDAAVRIEGLRRHGAALRGEGGGAAALRGLVLVAGLVLWLSGQAGSQAVAVVRGALGGVWRASSLVECLNSVARMQQGRHRKMTQGLLDLKRLYWNCRKFRTGRRRKHSPYDLNGLALPTEDWWELLQWTPQQLRERLATAQPSGQELSAQAVAA